MKCTARLRAKKDWTRCHWRSFQRSTAGPLCNAILSLFAQAFRLFFRSPARSLLASCSLFARHFSLKHLFRTLGLLLAFTTSRSTADERGWRQREMVNDLQKSVAPEDVERLPSAESNDLLSLLAVSRVTGKRRRLNKRWVQQCWENISNGAKGRCRLRNALRDGYELSSYPSIAEWKDRELVFIARRFAHPKQTIGLQSAS